MRKTIILMSILSLIVALSGCASIVGEKKQAMTFSSQPSEAKISIKDEKGAEIYKGETPTTVTLEKGCGFFCGHDYVVTFTKDGFKEQAVTVKTKPSGWYVAGNLAFGGLIGWLIVDPATGSMWTLSPEAVNPSLEAQQSADAGALNVALLEDVPANILPSLRRVQ